MSADDPHAAWAAAFLRNYASEGAAEPEPYPALDAEARALLASVDAGGVPAFMTENLRRIAEANGLKVGAGDTPNAVIEALRRKGQP